MASLERQADWRGLLLIPALLASLCTATWTEGHVEELLMQPLADGALLAHFEFSSAALLRSQHTGSFPPVLLGLAQRLGVSHMEVSFTQGRWVWEQQRGAGAAAAAPKPAGLELKVTFQPHVTDTQAAYGALTQSLGGLLCAGVATAPQLAVMAAPAVGWWLGSGPTPAVASAAAGGRQLYAWLPQETLCTENLSAWLNLLPCRQYAGFAALLHPGQLAAAPYYSLGLQLWVVSSGGNATGSSGSDSRSGGSSSSSDGQQGVVQVRQVLTAVLPQLHGTAAAAAGAAGRPGLIQAAFGAGALHACTAAASSRVYVAQPVGSSAGSDAGAAAGNAGEAGGCTVQQTAAGPLLSCEVSQLHAGDLPASMLQPSAGSHLSGSGDLSSAGLDQQPPQQLQVVQHLAAWGSRAGTLLLGVRVAVAGDAAGKTGGAAVASGTAGAAAGAEQEHCAGATSGSFTLLHIMQLLPWQLLIEAASLRMTLNGQPLQAHGPHLVWQAVDVRPDRTAVLELLLRLPAVPAEPAESALMWHELAVSIGYRTAFVGVFDHAPDASRGVDIPPALATWLPLACTNSFGSDSIVRDAGNGSSMMRDAGSGSSSNGSSSSSSSGDLWSSAAAPAATSPLLSRLLRDCGARQAYSNGGGGSVVPLPIPDFSMPFNVICFTSTLLAVLLGGTANTVLRSAEEVAGTAGGPGGASVWKRKLRRVLALLVLMGALAVYLDRDLQRQFDAALHHFVLGRAHAPEQHGEL